MCTCQHLGKESQPTLQHSFLHRSFPPKSAGKNAMNEKSCRNSLVLQININKFMFTGLVKVNISREFDMNRAQFHWFAIVECLSLQKHSQFCTKSKQDMFIRILLYNNVPVFHWLEVKNHSCSFDNLCKGELYTKQLKTALFTIIALSKQ